MSNFWPKRVTVVAEEIVAVVAYYISIVASPDVVYTIEQ